MNVIAVTGYMFTGSGAALDLLREYESCSPGKTQMEHIPVEHIINYVPGGVFDLEDKLLIGNDMHRSDEAVRSFYNKMKWLYDNDFTWFGSYKENLGKEYMDAVEAFLCSFTKKTSGTWYNRYKTVRYTPWKLALQIGAKLFLNRKIYKWGREYVIEDPKTQYYAYPTAEEFYDAAKTFENRFFDLLRIEPQKHLLLNHFLMPHNAYRVPNYFGENFRLIIVDRDVRDLFTFFKFIAPKKYAQFPIPKDYSEFVGFWKRSRGCIRPIEDSRILRIHFEDLVYNYDETVAKMESFAGLSAESHIRKKEYFNPNKSISNTQLFRLTPEYEKQAEQMARDLPEFLYDFPYENNTKLEDVF